MPGLLVLFVTCTALACLPGALARDGSSARSTSWDIPWTVVAAASGLAATTALALGLLCGKKNRPVAGATAGATASSLADEADSTGLGRLPIQRAAVTKTSSAGGSSGGKSSKSGGRSSSGSTSKNADSRGHRQSQEHRRSSGKRTPTGSTGGREVRGPRSQAGQQALSRNRSSSKGRRSSTGRREGDLGRKLGRKSTLQANSAGRRGGAKLDKKEIQVASAFMEALMDKQLALVCAILDGVAATDVDEVVLSILVIYDLNQEAPYLLKSVFARELGETNDPSALFRGNSRAAKLASMYGRFYCQAYLDKAVRPVLKRIVEDGKRLEVNTMFVSETEAQANRLVLQKHVGDLLSGFKAYVLQFPDTMRVLMTYLTTVVEGKFQGMGLKTLAAFVFLRFICPAIATPHTAFKRGFAAVPPDTTRTLVLVSKIVSSLAQDVRFGQKEAYMLPFNEFLDTHAEDMRDLLYAMSTASRSSMLSMEVPDFGNKRSTIQISDGADATNSATMKRRKGARHAIALMDLILRTPTVMELLKTGKDAASTRTIGEVEAALDMWSEMSKAYQASAS